MLCLISIFNFAVSQDNELIAWTDKNSHKSTTGCSSDDHFPMNCSSRAYSLLFQMDDDLEFPGFFKLGAIFGTNAIKKRKPVVQLSKFEIRAVVLATEDIHVQCIFCTD